ncbi:unnamed protein product [Trichobilharzia szidati]|nr:unnamed protein product [Trichobilharzia szidati]
MDVLLCTVLLALLQANLGVHSLSDIPNGEPTQPVADTVTPPQTQSSNPDADSQDNKNVQKEVAEVLTATENTEITTTSPDEVTERVEEKKMPMLGEDEDTIPPGYRQKSKNETSTEEENKQERKGKLVDVAVQTPPEFYKPQALNRITLSFYKTVVKIMERLSVAFEKISNDVEKLKEKLKPNRS